MKIGVVVIVVALFVLLCYACMSMSKKSVSSKGWTIYGSKGCSWTRKQFDEMDKKGIDYKFVDCTKEKCDGISGFPTLKNDDGTVKVGYTPM